MRSRAAAVLIAAVAALVAAPGASAAVELAKIGGFPQPIYVTAPPGDPQRLFVVEKGGQIELIHAGVRKPFLDVGGGIVTRSEDGLLSMAFAPDYATSGRFYVYYTAARPGDSAGDVLTLLEFRRSATDPDRADPTSRRVVLTIDHPSYSNHNGGQLAFGPGGRLYLAPGDGGGTNDPAGNAQNKAVLLGKLLRIDPRQNGGSPYTVPADNPFVGEVGSAPEIYAYGLRNPWRFSFDRLNGDLVIADVGQSAREEVDFAPHGTGAGADYGWRCREGTLATPNLIPPCTPSGNYAGPIFEYDHSGGRCAIVGGYVVRDRALPTLYGRYVYSDNCGGDIRSIALPPSSAGDSSTGLTRKGIYSFGEDACGHLYLATGGGEVDVLVDGTFKACPVKPLPPKLTLSGAGTQKLGRDRSLHLRVACSENCVITASGTVSVPGAKRLFKFGRQTWRLAARKPLQLRLQLGRRAAKAARRAIDRGRLVHATLKVIARNGAGNQSKASTTVRVLR